jgi:hypothetical protein
MLTDELQEKLIQSGRLKEKIDSESLNSLLLFENDVLTAKEIFNLNRDANLVTHSACDIGQNKIHLGDDLV